MQNDEVIWQIINHGFCSFKSKIARERTFCQNPHNVTGLCLRSACPLANSQYATVREEEGVCYLYIKTVERAHTPKYLWEKIKLSDNYMKALQTISQHLEYFPKYLVHRNKQRLTKIHEMLARMRKLKLAARPKLVTENTKIEQREKGREAKALKAAQLERAIEKELLERLKQANSEDQIVNYPEVNFNKVLSQAAAKFKEKAGKGEQLVDPDEELEYEDEAGEEKMSELQYEGVEGGEDDEGEEEEYNIQYVEDFDESDEEEDEVEDLADKFPKAGKSTKNSNSSSSKRKRPSYDDDEEEEDGEDEYGNSSSRGKVNKKKAAKKGGETTKKANKKRKGARVEIEYEEEEEEPEREKVKANALENMDFNF